MKKFGLRRLNRDNSAPISPDATVDSNKKGLRRRLRVFKTPRSQSEGNLFRSSSKRSFASSQDDWTLETFDEDHHQTDNNNERTGRELALVTPTSSDLTLTREYYSPPSLPDAIGFWVHSVHALVQSPELHQCLDASIQVVGSASHLVWHTALLPITLPAHIVGSTTHGVLSLSGSILQHSVDFVFHFPGSLLGMIGEVKDHVGGALLALAGEAPAKQLEDENYLDRLKLDFEMENKGGEPVQRLMTANYSKYLLRIDDLGILTEDKKEIRYIDLEGSRELVEKTLPRLMFTGLALLSNHPTVRLSQKMILNPDFEVGWNPEGATNKHMRKMAKMPSIERLAYLEKEILVWSGKYKVDGPAKDSSLPFFLARGIIRKTPRDFLNLLWDNSRTVEYNNFCLGRQTLITLEDKVLEGASEGTKAVCSETRIPFTGMSVMVTCMMHVRALPAPDEGFVILTRSLDSGVAGSHIGSDQNVEKGTHKSEILWGINILRKVPNHPHLTDLTSLSQVNSAMVPKFLAGKIAMMGVQEFFENIRKHNKS